MNEGRTRIAVRAATEADIGDIAEMLEDLAAGHPARHHPRPASSLHEAYFGAQPVAHLLVATNGDRVVGMCQWTRLYDMFWAMFGGELEWLIVRPEWRGRGISAVLVAQACREVRNVGGEFLKGGAEADATAALYERVAIGWPSRTVYLSAEAFQVFADLAGQSPRVIVKRLPDREMNRVEARPR